jgi:outer membrane protein assembly factor BamB
MKKITLVSLAIIISISNSFCQILSEWRGIGRTGVYNEKGLMKKWPEQGPEMLWHMDGLPKGFSSVSIANNTIYLTGIKDSIDILIAADMQGKLKWQTPFGHAWTASFTDSRCTPTVENNRLYVSSGNGDVACLNAIDGKVLWKVKAMEKFSGSYGKWGIAESPLLVDNKVIFTPGGEKTTVVALDKNTGETVWQTESLHDNAAYISPLLIEKGGKKLIVQVTENFILGVNADNGNILWKYDFGKFKDKKFWNIHTNTPLYYNNEIYVSTGYNHDGVKLKLSDDASSVSEVWRDTVLDCHHGGVVRIGNYIYGSNWISNSKGNWCCLDWTTGKSMYEKEWNSKGQIIADEDMLYLYDEKKGELALVKADPNKFEVISSFKVPMGTGQHWAHPVIHDGILYVRHGDVLMAYNIKGNVK